MALVDYTDSEDSDGDATANRNIHLGTVKLPRLKRKRASEDEEQSSLPPLPDSFHNLYASATKISQHDDPSLHGGRQRQIPHIEGLWPTHVYIEWYPSRPDFDALSNVLTQVESSLPKNIQLHSLLKSDLGAELPLHISLSRTLMLETKERQSFASNLEEAIDRCCVKPGLNWVANYENNRCFLVIRVQKSSSDELNKLLEATNRVANGHGQPSLYAPPTTWTPSNRAQRVDRLPKSVRNNPDGQPRNKSLLNKQISGTPFDASAHFHISIGWTLEKPPDTILQSSTENRAFEVAIHTVKRKIGNGVEIMQLASKPIESIGIVGS
ncbi:MAG: hypothetical protein Q9219_003664 [cf. Caloplaca sp. 3 TL-2023]